MEETISNDDRKCCKKAKIAWTDVEEADRISKLTDAVLCNILKSCSTKESVRTSILSKRWMHVWTSVPSLVLNDSEFLHDKERDTEDIENCFVNFMNRVLHLHNVSCIQKFHICCRRNCYEPSTVSAWINTAIGENVEEIVVEVYLIGWIDLSPRFFACEKLMFLKLESNFLLDVPKSLNFPNLKIARLINVDFSDDDSMKNFLSGCPVIEELDINVSANVQALRIQSSTLKKLSVRFDDDDERETEYRLVIESPNLQHLDLTNCLTEDYTVNFQPSLVEAHLSVVNENRYVSKEDFNSDRFIKLLQNISNTKHLEVVCVPIDSATLSVPDFHNLPAFVNLTCLKVVVSDDSWYVLPFLLEFSPNLHTCFIEKRVDVDEDIPCECQWKSSYCIPKCLLLCLEEIVVKNFEACKNEMEMAEYLLRNGRVLKKMLIKSVKLHKKEKSNVHKKLLKFPKASSTCQISFS